MLSLAQGDTVVIVGGGPAGSACAIKLLSESRRRGLELRVVLFEGKDFDVHYNQCVGVLSPPIDEILAGELGVELPRELIRRQIYGYRLFGPSRDILLVSHRGAAEVEVRLREATHAVSRNEFDRFMLERAREEGADVRASRVTHVEFVRSTEIDEVRVYSEGASVRAAAVVGAFGLDDAMLNVFERATPFRRPPKLLQSYITKLPSDPAFIHRRLGFIIQAYLLPPEVPNVEFGAITPKDDFIVVNVAGPKLTSSDMEAFLRLDRVRSRLPEMDPSSADYYTGWFPTAPGEHVYGRRYALAGDATGWMRPFKGKGINTALLTGARLASTMLERGVSREALRAYEESCRDLLDDHIYGAAVRGLARLTSRFTLDPMIEEAATAPALYDALYESVSGHASYRDIIRSSFSLGLARRVAFRAIGLRSRRGRRRMRGGGVSVRKMTARDIDAIMRIDEQITGEPHAAYYESRAASLVASHPDACLVAEDASGTPVGFVLASVRGWAYGVERHGWVEVIGVVPEWRGQGVSKALLDELIAYFRRVGVPSMQTVVDWNNGDLVEFFRANGFERGEYVNLVKEL